MVMFSSSYCVTCFVSAKFMARYRAEAPEPVDAAFISVDPGILQMRSPTGAPVSAGRGIRSRLTQQGRWPLSTSSPRWAR